MLCWISLIVILVRNSAHLSNQTDPRPTEIANRKSLDCALISSYFSFLVQCGIYDIAGKLLVLVLVYAQASTTPARPNDSHLLLVLPIGQSVPITPHDICSMVRELCSRSGRTFILGINSRLTCQDWHLL